MLSDPDSFVEFEGGLQGGDPLGFVDSRPYPERLDTARAHTARPEALRCGEADVFGLPVILAVMDFSFMGGSMGSVVGEKIARSAERALAQRRPLIICSSSGGARMQEGVLSLLQMAKTAAALRRLSRSGVPFFSVLCDPVYGGVSASFAALGDVILAESGARAGFAGPAVIEQTIRQTLPRGFQTADFLLARGHLDAVVNRSELRVTLGRLLRLHAQLPVAETVTALAARPTPIRPPEPTPRTAWETVQLARHPGRPHLGEYLEQVFEEFFELRGDRTQEDDPAIVGGLGTIAGRTVVVVGHRKGRGTKDGVHRNFGMPHPGGYRKALRLFRYAERFGLPLVTLVDTPGAYPGIRAEEENQSGAIAECIATLSELRVPVLTLIHGEGGSGGALALAVCDRLLMLENAVYSVISPEGCASILFHDAGRAAQAAAALRLTAADLHRMKIADQLVGEPPAGGHTDPSAVFEAVRTAIVAHLDELEGTEEATRLQQRYTRLRGFGELTQDI